MRWKPSEALRVLGAFAAAVVVLGLVALPVTGCAPTPAPVLPAIPVVQVPPPQPPEPPAQALPVCAIGPADAARANAASLDTLVWAPFGRTEIGWISYAPLVAHELGTDCEPQTPGFAAALAAWQETQRLPADGAMNPAAFDRMTGVLQTRRPFGQLTAQGVCPNPPADGALAAATPAEGYGGKAILLRPGALAAYRRMAAAARAEDPRIAADPRNLTIFSGYRSPAFDAARCARERNCDGLVRAPCSSHRTGLALDIYVGQAPGFGPDSSADLNRRFLSLTPSYRWLVANADRFGFVPYPFEPWHWEWTGEPP